MPKKTYKIRVECENCNASKEVEVEFGKPCNDLIDCPNCGCKKAKKRNPTVIWPPTTTWPSWVWPNTGWKFTSGTNTQES